MNRRQVKKKLTSRLGRSAARRRIVDQIALDAADALEAIGTTLADGDTNSAGCLLALAHENLTGQINELKGLL